MSWFKKEREHIIDPNLAIGDIVYGNFYVGDFYRDPKYNENGIYCFRSGKVEKITSEAIILVDENNRRAELWDTDLVKFGVRYENQN